MKFNLRNQLHLKFLEKFNFSRLKSIFGGYGLSILILLEFVKEHNLDGYYSEEEENVQRFLEI